MQSRLANSTAALLLLSILSTACLPQIRQLLPQPTPTEGTPIPVPVLVDLSELFPSTPTFYATPYSFSIRTEVIATLDIPTGEVIASDLFYGDAMGPLARQVPPGDYPVSLSLMNNEGQPWESVAAARIQFSSDQPTSWELALLAGQDPTTLESGQLFGYAVEPGTGSYSSPAAAAALAARLEADQAYIYEIIRAGEVHRNTGSWASIVPDLSTKVNIVFFASGYGDGAYASYWGLNLTGDPVCLITDFSLVHIENMPQQ